MLQLSQDIKEFVRMHVADDVHQLALQASKYPEIDFQLAIRQIAGKQIVKNKIPSWYENEEIIYPKHISLEQCSSELTANYKAQLFSGKTFVDLTGGFGVDFSFMSRSFEQATYVEQQNELCQISQSNFKSLGLDHTRIVNDSCLHYVSSIEKVDCIYIDPARRDKNGKKVAGIEDCSPNLAELRQTFVDKASSVIIKLSPMLDVSAALQILDYITEVHIVSVNNECKELLLVKHNKPSVSLTFICVNLNKAKEPEIFQFTKNQEKEASVSYTSNCKKYLYEPNASILKAGAYKIIAEKYNLEKLHPSTHLYTSDKLVTDFPGRSFNIQQICSLNSKVLKNTFKNLTHANISVRNLPITTDTIRKKIGIQDGGSHYVFGTTLRNNEKVLLICKKVE